MVMLEVNVVDECVLGLMWVMMLLGVREMVKEKMWRAFKAERAGVTLDDLDDVWLMK